MIDLVERLREYASDDHERGCQGRYYDCSCGYDGKRDPLLEEAADRIEQLEAALLTGVCMLSEMGLDPREKCQMAYDYMSAALEKRT